MIDKPISLLVTKVLAIIIANVTFVWTIIEFILYIAENKEFNWWSVYTFIISVVVAIIAIYFINIINMSKFKQGDKVKYSKETLTEFRESKRDFYSKHVFQIESIEDRCGLTILHLTCGTYLLKDEAIKVDKNTPLFQ